jgi:hypothetical protein
MQTSQIKGCKLITCIKNAIEHKDIALGAFLDTKGSFNRTSLDTIKQAAERHGTEPAICKRICSVLESSNIITTLSGENLKVSTGSGYLPLLWNYNRTLLFCFALTPIFTFILTRPSL